MKTSTTRPSTRTKRPLSWPSSSIEMMTMPCSSCKSLLLRDTKRQMITNRQRPSLMNVSSRWMVVMARVSTAEACPLQVNYRRHYQSSRRALVSSNMVDVKAQKLAMTLALLPLTRQTRRRLGLCRELLCSLDRNKSMVELKSSC